jgi:hypothetical protein
VREIEEAVGGFFGAKMVERRPIVWLSWSSDLRVEPVFAGDTSRRPDNERRISGGAKVGDLGAPDRTGDADVNFGLLLGRALGITICGVDALAEAFCGVRVELAALGDDWPRTGGAGERQSRRAFISGGGATLCTAVTATQSAGGIRRASPVVGGRQQPGHPGLGTVEDLAAGLDLAH